MAEHPRQRHVSIRAREEFLRVPGSVLGRARLVVRARAGEFERLVFVGEEKVDDARLQDSNQRRLAVTHNLERREVQAHERTLRLRRAHRRLAQLWAVQRVPLHVEQTGLDGPNASRVGFSSARMRRLAPRYVRMVRCPLFSTNDRHCALPGASSAVVSRRTGRTFCAARRER